VPRRIELKPEVEAWIKAQSRARGISVEALIESVIEGGFSGTSGEDDPRVSAMREAMSDELFLADLAETMEDFKHADYEQNR
jgi:hypothetical protein